MEATAPYLDAHIKGVVPELVSLYKYLCSIKLCECEQSRYWTLNAEYEISRLLPILVTQFSVRVVEIWKLIILVNLLKCLYENILWPAWFLVWISLRQHSIQKQVANRKIETKCCYTVVARCAFFSCEATLELALSVRSFVRSFVRS